MARKSGHKEVFAFLDLPNELQVLVLSYLTYDELAHHRLVCKAFDNTCKLLLNRGFSTVDKYHGECTRMVKAQLPRRESERRNHRLAQHCDILNSVETRISLLNMTFSKYMDLNLCCFIPGKVVDELYKVLRLVQSTKVPPRSYEVLRELRDISSMAMEHFDETIVPILKTKMFPAVSQININSLSPLHLPGHMRLSSSSAHETTDSKSIRLEIINLKQKQKQDNATLNECCKDTAFCKAKLTVYKQKIFQQEKKIQELVHVTTDQNAKIMDQEGRLNEMSKQLREYEQRFSNLLVELDHTERGNRRGTRNSCQQNPPTVPKRKLRNKPEPAVRKKLKSK